MSYPTLREPVELTDAELDAVSAGQLTQGAFGLVSANIGNTLNGLTISALNGNTATMPGLQGTSADRSETGRSIPAAGRLF